MEHDPQKPLWSEYFKWLAVYIILSGLTALFCYLWLSSNIGHNAGLESTISLTKALALGALVIIGGSEIVRQPGCPKPLYVVNIIIMIWAVILALGIVVRIVVGESIPDPPPNEFPFRGTYNLMASLMGNFLSITPIIMFAIVNAITALVAYSTNQHHIKRMALSFLCISDLPCIIPIIGVFAMYWFLADSQNDGSHGELFVSGAMAMFILISNILVLVVRYVAHPIVLGRSGTAEPPTDATTTTRAAAPTPSTA